MRLHFEKPRPKKLIEQEIAAAARTYEEEQQQKLGKWVAPQRWDRSARRNTLCEICFQPVSCCPSVDALCSLCNVVAHLSCLTDEQRSHSFRSSWICDDCVSDINYSKEQFVVTRTKKNYQEAAVASQIYIAKIWRRCRTIRKYRKTVLSLIRLQEFARSVYRRRIFMGFRLSLLRPMGVRIIRCLDLPIADSDTHKCDPYVYISTLNAGNEQDWLMNTRVISSELNPQFDESFLIPGISGNGKVVITVVDQDALRDQFVGEAILDLSVKHMWRCGGKFMLPLRRATHFLVRDGVRVPLDYTTIEPSGLIEVRVIPLTNLDNHCGYMCGPSIDDLMIAFRSLSTGNTTRQENHMFGEGLGKAAQRVSKQKLWVVVSGGKVYMHKRFKSPCIMFIDLERCSMKVFEKHGNYFFVLSLTGIPPLVFSPHNGSDVNRWKGAFISAWRKARSATYQFSSVVSDLVRLKKQSNAILTDSSAGVASPREASSAAAEALNFHMNEISEQDDDSESIGDDAPHGVCVDEDSAILRVRVQSPSAMSPVSVPPSVMSAAGQSSTRSNKRTFFPESPKKQHLEAECPSRRVNFLQPLDYVSPLKYRADMLSADIFQRPAPLEPMANAPTIVQSPCLIKRQSIPALSNKKGNMSPVRTRKHSSVTSPSRRELSAYSSPDDRFNTNSDVGFPSPLRKVSTTSSASVHSKGSTPLPPRKGSVVSGADSHRKASTMSGADFCRKASLVSGADSHRRGSLLVLPSTLNVAAQLSHDTITDTLENRLVTTSYINPGLHLVMDSDVQKKISRKR